jgi:hypothetical protein
VEYYDMPTIRRIVRESARDKYRFSSIVMGIVRSDAFRMRMVPLPEQGTTSTASLTKAEDRRP